MSDHLVEVSNLSFWYRQGEFEHQVLQDVSLHLNAGEVVGLTGPSGSGKSTLLTIIGGLRSAEHGTVTALETEVTGSSERQRVVLGALPNPWNPRAVLSPGFGLCIGSIRKRNSAERRHGRHGGDGCGWKKAWASIGKGHNRRSGVRVLRAI